MSLEHSPARSCKDAVPTEPPLNTDYWQALIDEEVAADFLDLSPRTLQGFRYKGGGPKFVRVSNRCVKYRRINCREWVEARLRTSTSNVGSEAA